MKCKIEAPKIGVRWQSHGNHQWPCSSWQNQHSSAGWLNKYHKPSHFTEKTNRKVLAVMH